VPSPELLLLLLLLMCQLHFALPAKTRVTRRCRCCCRCSFLAAALVIAAFIAVQYAVSLRPVSHHPKVRVGKGRIWFEQLLAVGLLQPDTQSAGSTAGEASEGFQARLSSSCQAAATVSACVRGGMLLPPFSWMYYADAT